MDGVSGRHAGPAARRGRGLARVLALGIGGAVVAVCCFSGGLLVGLQSPGGSLDQAVASIVTPAPQATKSKVTSPTATSKPSRAETSVVEHDQSVDVPGDAQPGRTISILGVGDILTHKEIIAQAIEDARGESPADFLPQLQGIEPLVSSADLAVCHMEYPVGSPEGPWTAWPGTPDAPPQLAEAVAGIGFDACSTASNHVLDQGFDGITRLLDALDANGLAHAGTARSADEASAPTIIEVKGVPVALLSYTYSLDGITCPDGDWCANLIDVDRMIAEAKAAREEGARLVVLSLHAGDEGNVPPSSQQLDVIAQLAESGQVDLVLGHHVHVVQPVDRVNGMWVAYGHGNLLTAQSRKDPRSGDGLISMFTFTEQADGSFQATDAVGYALHNYDFPFRLAIVPDEPEQTWEEAATWERTREAVMSFGAGDKGFRLLTWPLSTL